MLGINATHGYDACCKIGLNQVEGRGHAAVGGQVRSLRDGDCGEFL